MASNGTKRLGRVVVSTNRSRSRSARSGNKTQLQATVQNGLEAQDGSITASFAVDFDADVMKVVDSLEAAACQSDSGGYNESAPNQNVMGMESRAGQKLNHGNSVNNPGKRKNTPSRKSDARKLSLFGDNFENRKNESVTPTRSPLMKKKKGNEEALLSMSFNNTRLLCSASSNSKTGSSSGLNYSDPKKGNLRPSESGFLSAKPDSVHNRQRLTEENAEIETDVSPNLINDQKAGLKSGHCVTQSRDYGPSTTPKTGKRASKAHHTHHLQRKCIVESDLPIHSVRSEAVSVRKNTDETEGLKMTSAKNKENGQLNLIHDVSSKSQNSDSMKHRSDVPQVSCRVNSEKNRFTVLKPAIANQAKAESMTSVTGSSTGDELDGYAGGKGVSHAVRPKEQRLEGANDLVLVSEAVEPSLIEIASQNPEMLSLSSWGLPGPVLEAYHSQGITAMFPWQAECLTTGNVLSGSNLVYSAPTSAGKTMVSELLMLKRVLETRRKALFILPFVSVTREKMISLQHLYQDAGVRVGGFMGSHSPAGGFHSLDVAVCTIEKGNGLINRLLEDNKINELGVVVIDELHMVGDSNRGYLLELLLTKICYMAKKSQESSEQPIQLIGMSATLPNLNVLASWLDASLYHTDFRPVPLTEHIKVSTTIYDHSMVKVRDIDLKLTFQGDEDHIIPLCLETIMGGHAVLIFCPTKAWCEKMAEKIAREFYGLVKNPTALAAYVGESGFVKASEMAHLPLDQASLCNVLEQLGRSAVGVDPMLGKVVRYGVAYHHAGLTFDERDIVEGAFRQGIVKVLVATSTLSSGVNLPARRVIVRSPMFGGRVIDSLSYKQMAGRAGRKGVDTEGECVLMCKEGEKKAAQRLLQSDLSPVTSCLQNAENSCQLSRSMKRAILEIVVSSVASTPDDVARYVACTLLSASLPAGDDSTSALITACLAFLQDNEFVTLHTVRDGDEPELQKYQPTQLGSAVLASSMSPDEGLAVFAELQKARQCFVLANELHIIYLVTPIYSQEITSNLDWYHYYCLWEKLSPDMRLVAKTVGVEEGFLARAITGRVPSKTAAQARAIAVHRRFYTALALNELVQEVPLLEVAARYSCNKGQLQSLMQSAATFAGMVTVFCARLGWTNMELLLAQFQQRLTLGVTRELCDLVRIPLLTGTLARVLFNAGFQTVASVAHALPQDVETVFRKASPFQSNKKREGESEWDMEQRRKARCMWLAGRKGVTELEAASAIINEAKTIIQQELGVRIDWQDSPADTSSAGDDCEKVDLSESRTMLNSGSDLSVTSKESPQLSDCMSSVQNKTSPISIDAQQRNKTGPDTTSRNKRKRSSCGMGFETPVGTSQPKRSLMCKSGGKRNSGGRMMKTPPSGGGKTPSHERGLQKNRSPQDKSFFGQVVVSPPPSLKTQIQIASSRRSGERECVTAGVRSISILSSTPKTVGVQDKSAVRLFSKHQESNMTEHRLQHKGTHRGLCHSMKINAVHGHGFTKTFGIPQQGSTSTDAMKLIDDSCDYKSQSERNQEQLSELAPENVGARNKKVHKQSGDKTPTLLRDSGKGGNGDMVSCSDGEQHSLITAKVTVHKQQNENISKVSVSRQCLPSSEKCGQTTHTSSDSSPAGKTRIGSSVTISTIELRTTKEKLSAASSLQDEKDVEDTDDCFDDSLILNTQTDNLLSGELNDADFLVRKPSVNVTAISLCVPSPVIRNVDLSKEQSAGMYRDKSVLTIGGISDDKLIEKSGKSKSPQLCPEELVKQQHIEPCKLDKNFLSENKPDMVSLQQVRHEDKLTEDIFKSPFDSPPVPNKSLDYKTKRKTPKQSEVILRENTNIILTRNGNVLDRNDVSITPHSDSEADASAELIAASNFERVAYGEEDGVLEDSTNRSYMDLDIGFQGNLVCGDRDPEEREEEAEVPNPVRHQRQEEEYDIQEDLAIAANMSDSFSSTVNSFTQKPVGLTNARNNVGSLSAQSDGRRTSEADDFSNSFTASMMEKAFVDDSFCNSADTHCQITAFSSGTEKENIVVAYPGAAKHRTLTSQAGLKSSGRSKTIKERFTCSDTGQEKTPKEVKGVSGEPTTPPNNGDCVPPTPPDESSSSVSSPCVGFRRTPLRACRSKRELSQTAHQKVSRSVLNDKTTEKLSSKENKNTGPKSQNREKTLLDLKEAENRKNKLPLQCNAQNPSDKLKNTVDYLFANENAINAPKNQMPVEPDSPPSSQDSLCIIDVCASAELFSMFVSEWCSQEQFSISVACEKKHSPLVPGAGIGGKFVQGGSKGIQAEPSQVNGIVIPGDEDRVVVGLAVSWASLDAYYISFQAENSGTDSLLDDTLRAPCCTQSVSMEQRKGAVTDILQQTLGGPASHTVVAYDSKSAYSVLSQGMGAVFGKCRDPQIACWLLDPGAREKTLHSMVTNFLPADLPLLEGLGGSTGYSSLGLTVHTSASSSGRMRAVVESIVARRLMDYFSGQLTAAGLERAFVATEMPSMLTLARMELNGFGFSEEECESQKNLMTVKLSALEQEAYTLAGHPFSLTSTDDISQILYLELQLPVNGDPSASKPARTLGPNRRAPRGRQKSAFSTSKDVLEKLKPFHPLPAIILEWRRISSALTKHVYPLQKEKVFNERLNMYRMFSECQMHTATGRVSLSEPNLQNIPKDFEILLPDVIGESPPATHTIPTCYGSSRKKGGSARMQSMQGVTPRIVRVSDPSTAKHMAVSMRHAFVPFSGGVMLAADYSQLELRVIAHLSGDKKLITVLNNDGDVFKLIAAQWKNTLPEAVTAEERQHAKQICYGMLYGIGAKALGEQIGVDENDACVFMESFKAKYTGMRSYLRKTVEQCRENAYVMTVTGRRRYLSAIKDVNPHARAQAERQAVNTTVQGSAADIVKAAMNAIDQELSQTFPDTRLPHRHLGAQTGQPRGAFLTLQLHDELIYEVSAPDIKRVARIIKHCMESTTPLSVRLPVKIKVGPSWGRLEDFEI